MAKKRVLVVHGPNLNLLGLREPQIYGNLTLEEVNAFMAERGGELGLELEFFQSNHEGAIIDRIHAARGRFEWLIINAGA